jgi:integrase
MAHVEKRTQQRRDGAAGSVRWRVRYVAPDGQERSKTYLRKVDADRFAATVETDKARGEWIDPRLGRKTVEDWSAEWLAQLVHLRPKTTVGYQSLLRTCVLPTFGPLPLARVDQPAVAAWVAALRARGLSASRVRQAYRVLSGMLGAAVQAGYLAKTPCSGIKLPRITSRDATLLTASQVDDLAAAAGSSSVVIYLLAYGGLRWGELAALRRRRCDVLHSRIEIAEAMSDVNGQLVYGPTKTYERRWVRLPAFLTELLAEHLASVPLDPDALVFIGSRGAPLRYHSFRRAVWDRAVEAAGFPVHVTPHCLRHTCASLLVAAGADPVAVQRHLGHKDVTTTLNIYAGLFPNRLEEIVVALDAIHEEAQVGHQSAAIRQL